MGSHWPRGQSGPGGPYPRLPRVAQPVIAVSLCQVNPNRQLPLPARFELLALSLAPRGVSASARASLQAVVWPDDRVSCMVIPTVIDVGFERNPMFLP